MFTKKIPVIYLTKDKLKLAVVKLGKEPKVIKSDETGWTKDSLTKSFLEAKKQLKTKSIRILLADDLSYVLQLNIPFDTKSKDERKLIETKIKPEIPEILENDDWDYKETGRKTQSDKQIIAFAPVKSAFSVISQALVDAKLKLQAIEPEVISKIRNENPLIGLALKTDLKGSDEKVLNLNLKKLLPSKPQSKADEPVAQKVEKGSDGSELQSSAIAGTTPTNVKASSEPKGKDEKTSLTGTVPVTKPKPKLNKTLLIIFLVTFVLSGLIIGGILVQRNALETLPSPTPSPVIVASPDPSPTPTPSPSPEPEIILSDFKLQSLNGTGGKGVAGAVKDLLEAEGFEDIDADNAPKLNHTKTTIQLKANTPDKVWEVIERSLNSDYDLVKSEEALTDDSEYDVIITVGELLEEEN